MDARWIQYAILTLTANMHRSHGVHASAYILYIALGICSTLLIALYTANLTSAVLQEKALIGNNVKKVIVSQLPFSVVAGGPVLQMGYEFPGHSRRFQPKPQRRLYHPSCCGHGARLVARMRSARFRERRHQQIPYSMAIRAGTVDES
jgi:hypothetical protein